MINGAPTFADAQKLITLNFGVDLILQNRRPALPDSKLDPGASTHQYHRNCPAVEVLTQNTPPNAILCTEKTGFFILTPGKGAIFVSEVPPKGLVQILSLSSN